MANERLSIVEQIELECPKCLKRQSVERTSDDPSAATVCRQQLRMNAPQKKPTAAKSLGEQIEEDDKATAANLRVWNALRKTDPKHTKPFSRAGGFKGTALKPIWIVQRLTEQFGPVGEGWGMGRPEFQVVEVNGETLVYCTVACWHTNPENTFYGVGGDKVSVKRQNGPFNDDEAFKKAFTDAVNNAFKFAGVGADIHMGLFEDSKYLAEVTAEFTPKPDNPTTGEPKPKGREKLPDLKEGVPAPYPFITHLMTAAREFVHTLEGMGDMGEFIAWSKTDDVKGFVAQCKRDLPGWWGGGNGAPDDWVPLEIQVARKKRELEELETIRS
jgi:hypothetical protein